MGVSLHMWDEGTPLPYLPSMRPFPGEDGQGEDSG